MVETRTVTRLVCPDELLLPMPARVPFPADAVIEGSEAGMRAMAGRFAREDLLEARLRDATSQCPPTQAG